MKIFHEYINLEIQIKKIQKKLSATKNVMYCNIVFMIDIFVISKITQYRYYVIAITDVRSLGLSTKWRTLMIKKTMKVRENTFRKLEDPFENGAAKKYVFMLK